MRSRISPLCRLFSKPIWQNYRNSCISPVCAKHYSLVNLWPQCSSQGFSSLNKLFCIKKSRSFGPAILCSISASSNFPVRTFSAISSLDLESKHKLFSSIFLCQKFFSSTVGTIAKDEKNGKKVEEEPQNSSSPTFDEEKEAEKRRERVKKHTKYGSYAMLAFGIGGVISAVLQYGSPPRDENGQKISDEYSEYSLPMQYIFRTWKELRAWDMFIKEPSREKLLPEPLKDPYYQPKYTLVLEMTGVLVHPDWTYGTGWRFKKRPAVEYFLSQVGYPNFEVVIYTVESGMTAMPLIDNLDPQQLIMYKLFRDTTKYEKGHHIKDLSKLNRDLSRVIFIDWDTQAIKYQPENALRIPKWEGDESDTSLVDLAELLKVIMTSDVDDVRPIVQYYSQFDNPAKEFRERSKQVEEAQHNISAKKDDSLTKSYAGKLFGFKRH